MNTITRFFFVFLLFASISTARAEFVQTDYKPQNVVYDFYFDEPAEINSALYWLRSHINPLGESPYDYDISEHNIKVVIHGTELVTVAKKNYPKYKKAVERMRYYASLGVEFKVCRLAMQDYDYAPKDMQGFVDIVPSAMPELAHWQLQGYALMKPTVLEKKHAIEDIR